MANVEKEETPQGQEQESIPAEMRMYFPSDEDWTKVKKIVCYLADMSYGWYNRKYWEVVGLVLQRNGYIFPDIPRRQMARIFVACCPKLGSDYSLARAMEKYPITTRHVLTEDKDLKKHKKLKDDVDLVERYIKNVVKL